MDSSTDEFVWSPPSDPLKPSCPYLPGLTLHIQSHIPPAPFGDQAYGRGIRPDVPDNWLMTATQSQLVTTYPPLETGSPAKPRQSRLTITKTIATGDGRGPQVVACKVEPRDGESPFIAVAKIYDALYYDFCLEYIREPAVVVDTADKDYSREAAAYERLQEKLQTGSFAPRYFGSWTFTLPIGSNGQRPVRMILIEYLEGVSIHDLYVPNSSDPESGFDAFHLDEEYRLEVLARILDGVLRLLHIGVDQGDLAPRNIILVPRPTADADPHKPPRVVLIDYNTSVVYRLTWIKKHVMEDSPLPCNPMEANWGGPPSEFSGWWPRAWDRKPRLFQEWLAGRFGGVESSKYMPVRAKLEFTDP